MSGKLNKKLNMTKLSATHPKENNIIDGLEGDANADSDSVALGQPLKDGWKNSGCPWTKKLTPDRMVLPQARQLSIREHRAP